MLKYLLSVYCFMGLWKKDITEFTLFIEGIFIS